MTARACRTGLFALLPTLVLAASVALAQISDAETLAREAYDRGSEAFAAGRYDVAALELARADRLVPNPVALESALKAAVLADDPVLAMTLADRAEQRGATGDLAAAATRARERFAGRVGSLVVDCPPVPEATPCSARVDGREQPPGEARWVPAGDRTVEIEVAGSRSVHTVRVDPGARVSWRAPAPATPPAIVPQPAPLPPPPAAPVPRTEQRAPRKRPLSTTPFWIGVGVTGVLGALTAWQGIVTLDHHQAFLDGDDAAETPGRAAQLRTNVLLGGTVLAAAGTAAMGIFFVDWSGPSRGRSAGLGVTGTF